MRFVTQITRHKVEQTRLLSDVTVGRDRVALLDAGGVKQSAQRLYTLELVGGIFDHA